MSLAGRAFHWSPNSDSSASGRYPRGGKPTQQGGGTLGIDLAAFQAAAIDLTSLSQNTATSINYRQFLTGTSAATAVLSVAAVTGSLGSWGFDGTNTNLTNPNSLVDSGSIQVSATNGFSTVSFPVQSWAVSARPTTAIKWVPGWSMELDFGSGGGGLSGWLTQIAAIKNEPNITSVTYFGRWKDLEGPTAGDYSGNWSSKGDAGFQLIDTLLAACVAAGKKLFVNMQCQAYGNIQANAHGILPNYFETLVISDGKSPGYYTAPGAVGTLSTNTGTLALSAAVWDPIVMDKYIAMTNAYAARYNNNDTFCMWCGPGETAVGVTKGDSRGYSASAYVTQHNRWMVAARAAWTKTMVRAVLNYQGNDANMQSMLDTAYANKIVVGGPDTSRYRSITANRLFNGSNGTSPDYRGRNCWLAEVEFGYPVDFGSVAQGDTHSNVMQKIWDFLQSGSPSAGGSMQAQIIQMFRNEWAGPSGVDYPTWERDILPFIRTHPVPNTAYPSSW